MKELRALISRNTRLFFKDKGTFFTALITPGILLVLYATFLCNVYRNSFLSSLPEGCEIADKVLNGVVGGQLVASLLAVCGVTVAFSSNMLMVQDKVNGARRDLTMAPVKKSVMAMGYYIATLISTLVVCLAATALCFVYLANVGWYLTFKDAAMIVADVVLISFFGTALSSIVDVFLSSQGQISAVGTIVSAGYGFICGAYMPISQFGSGIRNAVSILPGTYGTSLLRNHAMRSAFEEMKAQGAPAEMVENMKRSVDCYPEFFGSAVSQGTMYLVLGGSIVVLVAAFVVINMLNKKKS